MAVMPGWWGLVPMTMPSGRRFVMSSLVDARCDVDVSALARMMTRSCMEHLEPIPLQWRRFCPVVDPALWPSRVPESINVIRSRPVVVYVRIARIVGRRILHRDVADVGYAARANKEQRA